MRGEGTEQEQRWLLNTEFRRMTPEQWEALKKAALLEEQRDTFWGLIDLFKEFGGLFQESFEDDWLAAEKTFGDLVESLTEFAAGIITPNDTRCRPQSGGGYNEPQSDKPAALTP